MYKNIAIVEMRRTGIPASIKIAQGMLESDLGRSPLAFEANNHFGIKCGKDWYGDIYYKHDDDTDSTGAVIESCFRAYKMQKPHIWHILISYSTPLRSQDMVFCSN
ncbi:MAG: glucosaminidase domain-containing protein [Saprospiraceae bacterium]|nr:glucosaminidase domain-containing protein [Saprospiraceae bacterium]